MRLDPSSQKDFGRYVAMSQIGLEMVAPIGLGAAADYYWHIGPWGVIVGVVIGFGGGLTHLIYMSQKSDDEPPKPDSGTP
jgi:F0F1-type ATP synthase assembly protein I